jgi:hypothetical protein
MINFGFWYTWLYFASLVFTGWLVTTQWVHGHPTCIYIFFISNSALYSVHCTVYTVQCTVYCTVHWTEHSELSKCLAAIPCFLTYTPPPPSCFLYTIPNTTQCSLLNHIQYTVLYTRFTLYCTLHFTLYFSLSFTPQSILKPKLLADMT